MRDREVEPMDDRVKIYDTVRGGQSLLHYNSRTANGHHTTNSSKLKKTNHWSNIFTWKKKAKQTQASILTYQFAAIDGKPNGGRPAMVSHKYSSVSTATGMGYSCVPVSTRVEPLRYAMPPTSRHPLLSSAVHASMRTMSTSASKQRHQRNSLFYSPWESVHEQSVQSVSRHCGHRTCPSNSCAQAYGSIASKASVKKSAIPIPKDSNNALRATRRLSRMQLYSLDEETAVRAPELKSKSTDSIFMPNKELPLKSYKSSTTLTTSESFTTEPSVRSGPKAGHVSSTVNERFLKFFKRTAGDPFNSIASRKSILEYEISAYDLIAKNVKLPLSEDDTDDNLSDNAVENGFGEHCDKSATGDARQSVKRNRKSDKSSKASLIESHANRRLNRANGSPSETTTTKTTTTTQASIANRLRIAGQGVQVSATRHCVTANSTRKADNSAANSNHCANAFPNCYVPFDSDRVIPVSSTVAAVANNIVTAVTTAASDELIAVPEPDYDTDENDSDQISTKAGESGPAFRRLKVSYSPPLASRRPHSGHEQSRNRAAAKNQASVWSNFDKYSKLANGSTTHDDLIYGEQRRAPYWSAARSESSETTPAAQGLEALAPPPPPPLSATPIKRESKRASETSLTSSVTSYHCELRDRLSSGSVKSILKKTCAASDAPNDKCDDNDNSDEVEQRVETVLETCDFLKTFREFKELRLRGGVRHRKHVHFRSRGDDSLIIDHISETIPEVDEVDDPIYDDVALPSALISRASDTSISETIVCDNNSEIYNDCRLDSSTMNDTERVVVPQQEEEEEEVEGVLDKEKEIIEFREFDPSEEESSSASWMKRVEPFKQQTSLAKGADCIEPAVVGPPALSANAFVSPAAKRFTSIGHALPSVKPTATHLLSATQTSNSPIGEKQLPNGALENESQPSVESHSISNSIRAAIDYNQSQLRAETQTETEIALPVSQDRRHKRSPLMCNGERQTLASSGNTEIETVNEPNGSSSLSHDCLLANERKSLSREWPQSESPYRCTISISNSANHRHPNHRTISNTISEMSRDSKTISAVNGDALSARHLAPQMRPTDRERLNDGPITIVCANRAIDKIVINVPLDSQLDNFNDHIYEELDSEPIYVDASDSSDHIRSIFDGASKDEILEFLEDAKERVGEDMLVDAVSDSEIIEAIDVIEDIDDSPVISAKNLIETTVSSNRRNRTSNVSNSSTDSTVTTTSSIDIDDDIMKCAITASSSAGQLVERNDSGVGAETSKPSRLRKLSLNDEVEHQCADCEMHVDPNEDDVTGLLHYPLFCHRCDKKRSERKEIISEIVDTEFKYGRDLRIIREEFHRPIEIAGLLSKEQLRGVFLNLDELIAVNSKFAEKLQDAIDIATEQGDEDYTTVNIGKLFRDSSAMLHAFEAYCVRQGSAALLLNHLEKEKELLRIFLRVSQMENTLLRRMNLRSFLVVPVQRVTKYPLLLNRLYKVTPYHHRDREAIREAQQKVELHLEHINQQTKGTIGTTTRIWRRISNLSTSHRRLNNVDDIGNIKIRKAALEILKWNQDETQFVTIGKLYYTSITDYTVNRKAKTLKFLTASALLVTVGRPNQNYRPDLVNTGEADRDLMFPRDNTGISDSVLLLVKEKCGRYVLCKEPFHLGSCVISSESDSDDIFEIHEYTTKESYLFKAESLSETKDWLKQLRYHSKDLGNWRRRRNALANIMMVRQ